MPKKKTPEKRPTIGPRTERKFRSMAPTLDRTSLLEDKGARRVVLSARQTTSKKAQTKKSMRVTQ